MKHQSLIIAAILFLMLPNIDSKAQKAEYSRVLAAIEAKFRFDLDTVNLCDVVVFNGVTYDSAAIRRELIKFRQDEIIVTELVDLTKSAFVHKRCSFLILIGTGHNQSKSDKSRILKKTRKNLNENVPELKISDFSCVSCKQVIIDGRSYGVYEAKKIVNALKVKEIKYIAEYVSANPDIYGRNAENGLIEIFLTEKKKNKKGW